MDGYKPKPKAYFEKMLVIDCETSGFARGEVDPSKEYQSVSWGIIVADTTTLKVHEELYLEIKWNGEAKWDNRATAVHGLSKAYLEENGMPEEEAVVQIGNLMLKHFGPKPMVRICGHNVSTFDIWFLRDLFNRHGLPFKTGNRHIDTFSIGFAVLEVFHSDDLFEILGLDRSNIHNALDDARCALETLRRIRLLWKTFVTPNL